MFKYKNDNRGSMTLEFMIIVPALFMWIAGLFVFFQGFHGWMKATKATYAVSDMLSRQTEVDDAFIRALDGVFDSIAQSEDNSQSWIRVTSVRKRDGELQSMWSTETSGTISSVTMAGLAKHVPELNEDEYVILVQGFRPFTPIFDWVGLDSMVFENNVATPLRFAARLVNTDKPPVVEPGEEIVDKQNILQPAIQPMWFN